MRWVIFADSGIVGCLILVALPLLGILLFFGWLAGLSLSHDARQADTPGTIHRVGYVVTGPGHTSPSNMPCFRTREDLDQWIQLAENDDGSAKNIYFAYDHALLLLNGDERVKILEQDGHIIRIRILPLDHGSSFDDFTNLHPKDIGQRCYTVDEFDLFQTN
jgi:hypothetical protein